MVKAVSRRTLLKSSASVAAGAAAAGVVSKASRTFAAPAVISQTGSNVTLNLWTSFGSGVNGDAQTAVIEGFQAANPGITINPTPYANYEEVANAIIAGLQVDEVPDVAVLSDVWWFTFYALQAIVDLNSLITADTKSDDYVQSLFSEYQRNGGQWAIPFARSTPLFYYNKTALDKAGLTTDIFAKWSDFKTAAPEFVSGGGGIKAAMSFVSCFILIPLPPAVGARPTLPHRRYRPPRLPRHARSGAVPTQRVS